LPCKLCEKRGYVCGGREKVLGQTALIEASKSNIPVNMMVKFVHRQPSTPVDEAITDLDRRYLSILGDDIVSAYYDGKPSWKLLPSLSGSRLWIPIFPLSSKVVRFSLLAYTASHSSHHFAKVHALEYMAKFFEYRKKGSIMNCEILLAMYLACSMESTQLRKHDSYFENIVVYLQSIICLHLESKAVPGDLTSTFIGDIVRLTVWQLSYLYGLHSAQITSLTRNRILDFCHRVLHIVLPDLNYLGQTVCEAILSHLFDLLLQVTQRVRLGLDSFDMRSIAHDPICLLHVCFQQLEKVLSTAPENGDGFVRFVSAAIRYEYIILDADLDFSERCGYSTAQKALGYMAVRVPKWESVWQLIALFWLSLPLLRFHPAESGIVPVQLVGNSSRPSMDTG